MSEETTSQVVALPSLVQSQPYGNLASNASALARPICCCHEVSFQGCKMRGFESSAIVDGSGSHQNPGYRMIAMLFCYMISQRYRTMPRDIPLTLERHPRFQISNIEDSLLVHRIRRALRTNMTTSS